MFRLKNKNWIEQICKSKRFVGLGPATMSKLDHHFDDLYSVIRDGNVNQLTEIIDINRAVILVEEFKTNIAFFSLLEWFGRFGIEKPLAIKTIKLLGDNVIQEITENPYQLISILRWQDVDKIGLKLGFSKDCERRLIAAAESILYELLDTGDTFVNRNDLIDKLKKRIKNHKIDPNDVIEIAISDGAIMRLEDGFQAVGAFYIESFLAEEIITNQSSGQMVLFDQEIVESKINQQLNRYQKLEGLRLNKEQILAIKMIFRERFSLLSGGAGTGKTSTLKAVHYIAQLTQKPIIQIALSGKAALRMKEATGVRAYTIASTIRKLKTKKLVVDFATIVLIDESSLVDAALLYQFINLIPPDINICMIGDPHQLPPISFGSPFVDFLNFGLKNITLNKIHRQEASSGIPVISKMVKNGQKIRLPQFAGIEDGVSIVDCQQDQMLDKIKDLRKVFQFEDSQIITANKKTLNGVDQINQFFHGQRIEKVKYDVIAEGEPVIWTHNDWGRDLANGAIGKITKVNGRGSVSAEFDQVSHDLLHSDFVNIELAYCITIHKSQGSQWDRIILPISPSRLLDRALIYTAITRAAKQVVLVGDAELINNAIAKDPKVRKTGIEKHLESICNYA